VTNHYVDLGKDALAYVGGEVGVRVNDKIYKINARWPVAQCRLSNIIG